MTSGAMTTGRVDAREVAARALELRATAKGLRDVDETALARLVAAMHELAVDPRLLNGLMGSTGLSRAMIEWGLRTTFESLDVDRIERVRDAAPGYATSPYRLASIVLAGNVFTAGARAMLWPLVLGLPIVVKASSRDAVFPHALLRALPPEFARCAQVYAFRGGREELERALFQHADVVHAYGADETLRALAPLVPPRGHFVGHGHGIGVAYVEAFDDADVAGLATDLAAYDQRGCLSPVEVLVRGSRETARRFAQALHEELTALDVTLPRGPLSRELSSAQAQWRGVALATAELLEGPHHALALEDDVPLPRGVGGRNLTIRASAGAEHAAQHWGALGASLKCIGVSRACLDRDAAPAPMHTRPRVCALGQMQRPSFDSHADGEPPSYGMVPTTRR